MNRYRDKKDGKIAIHYWVDGDQLWRCRLRWFRGDLLKVERSEKLIHKFASAPEAQQAFVALRDKKIKASEKC